MNLIIIVNSKNKPFSHMKVMSPKMVNQMKEQCDKYKAIFGEEFKVKRCLVTRQGIKIV